MDIRKQLNLPRAIMAVAMTVAMFFPVIADAVSIGDVVLQSRFGDPLLARIDLKVDSGEQVDDSCLSLAAPDPLDEDIGFYLTKVKLSVITEGELKYVNISSSMPFNDPFAKLRLQVKCAGTGSVIKTLTILPDLDTSVPLAAITAPAAHSTEEVISAPPQSNKRDVAPPQNQRNNQDALPEVKKQTPKKASGPSHKQLAQSAPANDRKKSGSPTVRLEVSGEPLDESRLGKVSKEERRLLLSRQKMLDADDQMVKFLAMQHQIKQLQNELVALESQLSLLGITPVTVASSVPAAVSAPATSASAIVSASAIPQASTPKPANVVKPAAGQQDNSNLPNGLFAAFGLVLIIIALWQGLRYYTKVKSHTGINLQQETEPILKLSAGAASTTGQPAPTPAAPVKFAISEAEESEVDSMLEEAELYSTHGRPAKAAELLQAIIQRSPAKLDAWSLLFSIYSSLGKASEFEKAAREFLKYHESNPTWSKIQALGRTLDKSNPLYVDNNIDAAASSALEDAISSFRPVGDILIEMGVLTEQNLQNCLDTFDPKKHGRFGGYLLARKEITLEQLDQALLLQQGKRG